MKDWEKALGLLAAGGFGYLIGRSGMDGWRPIAKKFAERRSHIEHQKIIPPTGLFAKSPNAKIAFWEGIGSYSFGFPNASIPIVFKALEIGLKIKYKEVEGRDYKKQGIKGLINWAEDYLQDMKELAHGFRILRNSIHQDKSLEEGDALDTIKYTSKIINALFPFTAGEIRWVCPYCNILYTGSIVDKKDYFIGSTVNRYCNTCKKEYPMTFVL